MSVTQSGLTRKSLSNMTKDELHVLLTSLEIEFKGDETNPVLVSLVEESGKYVTKNEKGAGKVKVGKDGIRTHQTLGKYLKVRVHPTGSANANTSIFVSINLYSVEFQPNEIVELPIAVIKFLKDSGDVEHYYDATAMTENGNVGEHTSRTIPKYIVELVNDELEEVI
ncbi:MAG: hypothetical protein GQ570_08590 [Helicobacteraceae bacterium]|nr:hypothetical protein [Helicobacteraceae bacterium]